MEYPIWLYFLIGLIFIVSSFAATFLVSFFGGHRDIKSISMASLLLLLMHGGISILGLGGTIAFGVGGILSIIIFTKLLDFEPKGALFAGILYSMIFSILSIVIVGSIISDNYDSRTSNLPGNIEYMSDDQIKNLIENNPNFISK